MKAKNNLTGDLFYAGVILNVIPCKHNILFVILIIMICLAKEPTLMVVSIGFIIRGPYWSEKCFLLLRRSIMILSELQPNQRRPNLK